MGIAEVSFQIIQRSSWRKSQTDPIEEGLDHMCLIHFGGKTFAKEVQ